MISCKRALFFICLLVAGGLAVYGRYVEPELIKIQKIDVGKAVNIPALKGRKVLHLSDLHIEKFGKRHKRLLEKINLVDPDLIFLTGDYIQWYGSNKGALEFLSRLRARYGVYAVMGDYDYSDSKNSCLFCHEKNSAEFTKQHNVVMLRNNTVKVDIDGQSVHVGGMDREYDGSRLEVSASTHEATPSVLLLCHSPMGFDTLPSNRNIFMFAGDTHGGQIFLPRWIYRIFGYHKNVKYNSGLFQNKNNHMYVTRGIGTSHFKFRLFCAPEVAVFYF